jgi:hypothetical protein
MDTVQIAKALLEGKGCDTCKHAYYDVLGFLCKHQGQYDFSRPDTGTCKEWER